MRNFLFLFLCFGILALRSWGQDNLEDTSARSYYFNPLKVKRDPFLPPTKLVKGGANDLVNFDVGEMTLVAVLSGMGAPKAMVLLPNGKTHIVQKGDRLGRNRGRVKNITANEVFIEESFKDYKNTQRSSTSSLRLAD